MGFMEMVALGCHLDDPPKLNGYILIQSITPSRFKEPPPHVLPAWTRLSTLLPEG